MTEVCDGCGFEAANGAGLAAHQRHCDYENESEESPDYNWDDSVSTAVADAVAERDSYECRRCGDETDLTIHFYDDDGADIPQNLVLLCGDCGALVEGGHPKVKRDQIRNDS